MNLYDELFEEPIQPELGISRISSTFSFMHSKVGPAFVLLISSTLFYISPLDKRVMGFILLYVVIGMTFHIRNMYDDVYIDYKRQKFIAKGNWRNRTIEKNFSELVKVKRPFFSKPFQTEV